MKNYVVIFIFSKDFKKILLVKRNKEPYKNCWNGVGGKIEQGETIFEAAIRECKEETNIDIINPKLLVTYIYPENNTMNSGITLHILYTSDDFIQTENNNYEGIFKWKPTQFAMNFNSKELAGYGNLAQIIKEILVTEGVDSFYD